MTESPAPIEVPTWFKAGVMAASAGLGLVGAEVIVRAGSGGALPHLRLFVQDGDRIGLQPDACAAVRHAAGHRFEVCADAGGHRRLPAETPQEATAPWLAVGDSQVLGMGVDGSETFAARNGWINGGVPGHGVEDAIATARAAAGEDATSGVVVVVNQANDWEEALVPAGRRYRVAGGMLLRSATATTGGTVFWDSPLSRLHLLSYAALLVSAPRVADEATAPGWLADPRSQQATSAAMAGAIRAFATSHPDLTVITAFLPVDVAISEDRVPSSPFGRYAGSVTPAPWEESTLRDQLRSALDGSPVRFVDLGAPLAATPDAFLDADYHLSAAGHAAVAAHLAEVTR